MSITREPGMGYMGTFCTISTIFKTCFMILLCLKNWGSSLLKWMLHMVTLSERVNSQWKKNQTNTPWARCAKSASTALSRVDRLHPWHDVVKMTSYPCSLPPPTTYNPSLIMKKHHTDLSRGAFYKIPDQYFSKLSRSTKTEKAWENVTDKRSLRRHKN